MFDKPTWVLFMSASKLDNLTPIWYNKIYELIFEEKICRKKVMKNWIN